MNKIRSFLILTVLCGCATASDLVEVSGDVTWNGQPMPIGTIVLHPRDPKIAPAGGQIRDGRFKLQCKPGSMRVQIEAPRDTNQIDPDTGSRLGEMYVPARYNTQTELEADVTSSGPNHFEFQLKD